MSKDKRLFSYLLTLDNCVNKLYNGYTIHPSVELAYDPLEMSDWTWFWSVAWPRFWNSDVGKAWSIGIFIATTLFTMACCMIYPPAILTYTMAYVAGVAGFLVGAAICGFQSMSTGGDFWEGFADYVTNNWSQTLAITSLTCIVSVGFQTAAYLNARCKVARVVKQYFKDNNIDFKYYRKVARAFENDIKITTISDDVLVNRYWGAGANEVGRWVTPYQYENPAAMLALPPNNSVINMTQFIIPKGTVILEGTVASLFGQPGGGWQYYLANPSWLMKF